MGIKAVINLYEPLIKKIKHQIQVAVFALYFTKHEHKIDFWKKVKYKHKHATSVQPLILKYKNAFGPNCVSLIIDHPVQE